MATPRIVFDHVSVDFTTDHGPLRVVDDVSLTVSENEFICIVGPSGCGKTTLMNIMAGFVPVTSGRATLDGRPIEGPGRDRGVIFQEYGVFPWLTVPTSGQSATYQSSSLWIKAVNVRVM